MFTRTAGGTICALVALFVEVCLCRTDFSESVPKVLKASSESIKMKCCFRG